MTRCERLSMLSHARPRPYAECPYISNPTTAWEALLWWQEDAGDGRKACHAMARARKGWGAARLCVAVSGWIEWLEGQRAAKATMGAGVAWLVAQAERGALWYWRRAVAGATRAREAELKRKAAVGYRRLRQAVALYTLRWHGTRSRRLRLVWCGRYPARSALRPPPEGWPWCALATVRRRKAFRHLQGIVAMREAAAKAGRVAWAHRLEATRWEAVPAMEGWRRHAREEGRRRAGRAQGLKIWHRKLVHGWGLVFRTKAWRRWRKVPVSD